MSIMPQSALNTSGPKNMLKPLLFVYWKHPESFHLQKEMYLSFKKLCHLYKCSFIQQVFSKHVLWGSKEQKLSTLMKANIPVYFAFRKQSQLPILKSLGHYHKLPSHQKKIRKYYFITLKIGNLNFKRHCPTFCKDKSFLG